MSEENVMAALDANKEVGTEQQVSKKRTTSKKITPPNAENLQDVQDKASEEWVLNAQEDEDVEATDAVVLDFPCNVVIHNYTYSAMAFPEVMSDRIKGGESVIVAVKTQAILDSLQRNALATNSIGHWEAPNGVFIELAKTEEGV